MSSASGECNRGRYDGQIGILHCEIVRAENLLAMDRSLFGAGKSDPYCKMEVPGQEDRKTPTISKNLNPVWNHEMRPLVVFSDGNGSVELTVWDHDTVGRDDLIGIAVLPFVSVNGESPCELTLPLETQAGDRAGKIIVRTGVRWAIDYVAGDSGIGETNNPFPRTRRWTERFLCAAADIRERRGCSSSPRKGGGLHRLWRDAIAVSENETLPPEDGAGNPAMVAAARANAHLAAPRNTMVAGVKALGESALMLLKAEHRSVEHIDGLISTAIGVKRTLARFKDDLNKVCGLLHAARKHCAHRDEISIVSHVEGAMKNALANALVDFNVAWQHINWCKEAIDAEHEMEVKARTARKRGLVKGVLLLTVLGLYIPYSRTNLI